jgi:hypothetical protein
MQEPSYPSRGDRKAPTPHMLKNLFSKGPAASEPQAETSPTRPEPGEARIYTVGWLLNTEHASVIWDSPRQVRIESQSSDPRSVGQCPSVLDFDRRLYAINCPIDVHLRLNLTTTGMDVTNVLADKSPIRADALQKWIVFQPRHEWRHPQRPVLQMLTSYVFVSDDPVYINQLPPFLNYTGDARPGIQIGGRFPIDVWPRALMWAFEWHDTKKDLILRRGRSEEDAGTGKLHGLDHRGDRDRRADVFAVQDRARAAAGEAAVSQGLAARRRAEPRQDRN